MKKKKGVRQLKKDVWKVFSKFIRTRDALITTGTLDRGKCCTCGKTNDIKKMDAGHWRSRGRNNTLFDEHNVQLQCKRCNGPKSGMSEEFRRYLIDLYGEQEVERIYRASNDFKQFKTYELEELLAYYKEELKVMTEGNL